jgi:GT2 family glycosyltransferase
MVTYRRRSWLAESVGAALGQTIPPAVLVVVDNDADPEVRSYIEGLKPEDTVVHYASNSSNLGPAGGLRRGLEALAEVDPGEHIEHVLFLDDDDPLPTAEAVAVLLHFRAELGEQTRIGAVGIVGARWDDRRACIRRVADSELTGAVSVDYIGGGQAPLYDRAALKEAGGVDASLFFGFDDLDIGLRLQSAGFALYAHGDLWRQERARNSRLGLGPQLTPTCPESPWRSYYSARNLILILRAHRSFRQALQATLRQILGGFRNGSCFRARLHGVVDAWLGRRGVRMLPDCDQGKPQAQY